jgi:hypothetical protein
MEQLTFLILINLPGIGKDLLSAGEYEGNSMYGIFSHYALYL